MKIKHKLFGFSTKNLYLAELVRYEKEDSYGKCFSTVTNHYAYHLVPRKYIIGRKNPKTLNEEFSDIFTGSLYNAYGDHHLENKEIVAYPISPIISNKSRIRYKDAQEILKI